MRCSFILALLLAFPADAMVLRYSFRAQDSSADPTAIIPTYYVATLTSELTGVSGARKGDIGFSKQSNVLYYHDGTAWQATGSGGSGGAAWGSITGTLSSQTDLSTALSGKAALSHTHVESDVTSLVSDLAGKAPTVHTHAQSDVTGLVAALAGKASSSHTHPGSDITSAVATASALAANPTDCSVGQYATTIDAGGNLTCATVAYGQLSGTPSIPSVPTGTGFWHITSGASDSASRLVSLTANTDVAANQGATTTVLHGNAAGQPSFGAVSLTTDVSGDLPFSSLAQSSAASKLLGRGSAAGAGDFQEIALGTNLTMSGTTLNGPIVPTDISAASYITRVAEANLSNETAMGALGTGLVLNTTTTGTPSIYAGATCSANQYANATSASGALTCAQVAYSQVTGTPTIPVDLSAEPFLTSAASANLSAERVLSNGTNTTVDTATAGQIKVNFSGSIAEASVANLTTDLAAKAPTARLLNTTAPVTGGGDLSADRTIAVSDFVASGASHARGTVPDPGASAGTTRFLREDATWAAPASGGANFVSATVDFGAYPGSANAVVTVTGATWVTASSLVTCAPTMFATADRVDGAEDAILEGLSIAVSARVAGTGFKVSAAPAMGSAIGKFLLSCTGV